MFGAVTQSSEPSVAASAEVFRLWMTFHVALCPPAPTKAEPRPGTMDITEEDVAMAVIGTEKPLVTSQGVPGLNQTLRELSRLVLSFFFFFL